MYGWISIIRAYGDLGRVLQFRHFSRRTIVQLDEDHFMTKSVRVGAMDWRDPAWAGSFYPADMPEEWRLSFYASQFNCVFLKASEWRQAQPQELEQWGDDVHSQFVFLLENDENLSLPTALADKAVMLSAEDPRIFWFDGRSDLRQLSHQINAKVDGMDIFLISRDGGLGQMEQVGTLLELMGL